MCLQLVFLSSIVALAACTPDDLQARVDHVIDGDTLIVPISDRQERVRLSRINAPEIKAASQEEMMHGIGARTYMEGLVRASPVVALRSPTFRWWRFTRKPTWCGGMS